MDLKYKAFAPKFKAAGADGTASFVIATLGVEDSDGDVTLPGFFGKQDVMVLPAHDSRHVPIGKGTIHEDGNEAIADVRFNMAIASAAEWHSALKFDLDHPGNSGPLQEFSYGYQVLPGGARMGDLGGKQVQFLQPLDDGSPGVNVFEVSPVLRGAGVGTRTLGAKSDGQFSEHAKSVFTDLDELITRFEGVIAFRATQGKSRLSEHSIELLDQADVLFKRLTAMREAPPEFSDEMWREFARLVATTTNGVTP